MSDTEKSTQTEDLNNIEEPPPPEPIVKIRKPRAKKYPTNKEYNNRYYHDVLKQQEKKECQYCGNLFVCSSSLHRHQRRSPKCLAKQLQKHIDEMKANMQF